MYASLNSQNPKTYFNVRLGAAWLKIRKYNISLLEYTITMELFYKKKETTGFELPGKLEMLLNIALKDGEVSEKELAVLRAEAQKHDISADELDMIIESRMPKQEKEDATSTETRITADELIEVINANLYLESDSVVQTFQKYEILCDYSEKKMSKQDREKLHRAQLTYISSIVSPTDKKVMLELIAHALPYTKKDIKSKALKTASNIGFTALKAVSITAKVATLGIAGKVMDNLEEVMDNLEEFTQQAIVSNAEELSNAWRSKMDSLFEDAKDLAGNLFSGDRQFQAKLSALSSQYKK